MLINVGDSKQDIAFNNMMISDKDESGTVKYYGYLSKGGKWLILKWDTNADTFRYATGESDYETNWADRTMLNYKYYNEV